ncbi:MAG: transporter substrate-binding domain-containing protein [Sedimenticola sp.]
MKWNNSGSCCGTDMTFPYLFFLCLMLTAQPLYAELLILHVDLPQHPSEAAREQVNRLKGLAEKHDMQLKFKAVPWNRGLVMIEKGVADGIIDASYNVKRAQYAVYPMKNGELDLSRKIGEGGTYHLYKNKNSTIAWDGEKFTNPDGPVAAKDGYAVIVDLEKHDNIEIVVSPNENIIVRDLLSGRIAGYAAFDTEIQNYSDTQQFKNTIIKEPIPIRQKPYFVIFSKTSYAKKKDEIEKFWNMLRH